MCLCLLVDLVLELKNTKPGLLNCKESKKKNVVYKFHTPVGFGSIFETRNKTSLFLLSAFQQAICKGQNIMLLLNCSVVVLESHLVFSHDSLHPYG